MFCTFLFYINTLMKKFWADAMAIFKLLCVFRWSPSNQKSLIIEKRNKYEKNYFSLQHWYLYKPGSSRLEKSSMTGLWFNPWERDVYLIIYLLICCLFISLSRMSIFYSDFFWKKIFFCFNYFLFHISKCGGTCFSWTCLNGCFLKFSLSSLRHAKKGNDEPTRNLFSD